MVTNDEINERRRARLAGHGAGEAATVHGSTKIDGVGEYTDAWRHTGIPARDLRPEANFNVRTWEIIKNAFGKDGPGILVETGSRRGAFAFGAVKNLKRTQVFSIDPWTGRMGQGCLSAYLRRVPELFTRVHPLPGVSVNWAKVFPFKVDCLMVSGVADPASMKTELTLWLPLVNEGGLVLVQDVTEDAMFAVVSALAPGGEREKLGPAHVLTYWAAV
jgi:hypothetical protein